LGEIERKSSVGQKRWLSGGKLKVEDLWGVEKVEKVGKVEEV